MSSKTTYWLLIAVALMAFNHVQAQTRQSVYTNLDPKLCKTLKSDPSEAGEYLGRCNGTAGYSLLVAEGDLRQNITVITPRGTKHSLDLWSLVSPAFSSLGPKAEWRVIRQKNKTVPVSLIVRYNASENNEQPNKLTSYLVVVKITADEICVTDKIKPVPNANEEARRLADTPGRPCLQAPN
ncbi:MAG TPA: hypothetical protein VI306_10110 [Pyrinomonadaceae bacterium]